MESILKQLFWLWTPVSHLPEWLRVFIVLFLIVQIVRPILLKLGPILLHWVCRGLKELLYLVTYPFMAMVSSIQKNRRESGDGGMPSWVDRVEDSFAFFERVFNKVIGMTRRRRNRRMKKWTFYGAFAFAILLTAAIVNNPKEWYSLKWQKAEVWLSQDVPIAAPETKEFVLNAPYKTGGNIREAPSLAAQRLYTIVGGEVVRFLNEEQVDSKGLTWLKVEAAHGKIVGWISSRIVKEK